MKLKTDQEIKSTVSQLIEVLKSGQEAESDKIDFKSEWYDLKNRKDVMEFLKDSSAIPSSCANPCLAVHYLKNGTTSNKQANFRVVSGLHE